MEVSIKSGKITLSDNWNPKLDKVPARSTPDTAFFSLGNHYQDYGAPSRYYQWGMVSYFTNTETAPITGISSVTQGYRTRGIDATTRQCGSTGDAHSIEIISGQYNAKGIVKFTKDQPFAQFIKPTWKGSRFCVGDTIELPGILPEGTVVEHLVFEDGLLRSGKEVTSINIVDGGEGYQVGDSVFLQEGVLGVSCIALVDEVSSSGSVRRLQVEDPGAFHQNDPIFEPVGGSGSGLIVTAKFGIIGKGHPTQIVLSKYPIESYEGEVEFIPSLDNNNIGLLITGSGNGGTDKKGNKNGKAITIQSYKDAAYSIGLQFTKSGIRSDGNGIEWNFADSMNLIRMGSGKLDQSVINLSNMDMDSVINVPESNNLNKSIIETKDQILASGSFSVGDEETKLSFYGKEPVSKPPTPTTLEELITSLQNLGLIE